MNLGEMREYARMLRSLQGRRPKGEAVPLPELSGLDLPAWVGEGDPPRRPEREAYAFMRYYSPEGAPLPEGPAGEAMFAYFRSRRGAVMRSRPFYRAGVRIQVSTAYLGIDHGWGDQPVLVWETMVFQHGVPERGHLGDACESWRYCHRAAALAGHRAVVARIAAAQRARRAAWRERRVYALPYPHLGWR